MASRIGAFVVFVFARGQVYKDQRFEQTKRLAELHELYGKNVSCATWLPSEKILRSYVDQIKQGVAPMHLLSTVDRSFEMGMHTAVWAPWALKRVLIPHNTQHSIGQYFAKHSPCVRGLDFSTLLLVSGANQTMFSGLQHGIMWHAVAEARLRNVPLWDWLLGEEGCGPLLRVNFRMFGSCVHGFGHGVKANIANIDEALDICKKNSKMGCSCATGVYMQAEMDMAPPAQHHHLRRLGVNLIRQRGLRGSDRALQSNKSSMGDFDANVRDMLMDPGIGTKEKRAISIAQKLRSSEIELDDIKFLSTQDVETITTSIAERAKLKRLVVSLNAGTSIDRSIPKQNRKIDRNPSVSTPSVSNPSASNPSVSHTSTGWYDCSKHAFRKECWYITYRFYQHLKISIPPCLRGECSYGWGALEVNRGLRRSRQLTVPSSCSAFEAARDRSLCIRGARHEISKCLSESPEMYRRPLPRIYRLIIEAQKDPDQFAAAFCKKQKDRIQCEVDIKHSLSYKDFECTAPDELALDAEPAP